MTSKDAEAAAAIAADDDKKKDVPGKFYSDEIIHRVYIIDSVKLYVQVERTSNHMVAGVKLKQP